ncbi:hypothetical protein [Pseudaestuariivita rosea]|uniref:hypothetical protein n=1 Tax=Pseudaestuariivita rosea TaxID=2763263 RepID=UPI001ABA2CC6|nr:hypothetical protein [Pseudaestuariivita rosea]
MRFTVQGGYAFGVSHDITDFDQLAVARAGQLTGAWRFEFEDEGGPTGNAHLDASTLFRLTRNGPSLSGLMRFHMHEIDGSEPGSGWLYLSYEGGEMTFEGSKATFVVEGEFFGGTGRYEGATGSLRVTSVNGFDTGGGELILRDEN